MKWLTYLMVVWCCGALQAADWPQFLGPSRDGVAAESEKALPATFDAEPKPLWTYTLGSGHAGPAVADGKVVVFHRKGSEVVIEALNAITGQPIWDKHYPTSYRDSFGMDDGPRAVPTISNGSVFVHGADGQVYALDLASGKELWAADTAVAQDSPQGYFGRACAPLVVDGKVIITTGGKSAVTAFDAKDGKVVWSGGEDEASYASPVMLDDKVMIAWLRNNLTTFNVTDGKVLATERFRPTIDASVSAATPIKTDAGWFVTAEYDVGGSLWEISPDGKLKQTWLDDSTLNAHYATPVYHDGHVYGFDGRQERGMTLRCVDTKTKKVTWESPSVRGGTLLRVKDKLLVLTEEGEFWMVSTNPTKFEQLTTTQLLKSGHRSYAAYSNGVYYARDEEKLVAVRLVE